MKFEKSHRTFRNEITLFVAGLAAALSLAGAAAQPLTVVEYYNRVIDGYFITARANEQAALDTLVDFERTGMSFAAVTGGPLNPNSFCRFYISLAEPFTSTHFYGLQTPDCDAISQFKPAGFTYEGIEFAAGLKDGEECPAATPVAVYRSFRPAEAGRTSNHRYTVSRVSYRKMTAAGWTPEGIAFCVEAADDATPAWPPATTGLYTGTSKFKAGALNGYTVRDVPHGRDIPVLIRYPIGAGNAKLPVIVWSHGGEKNVNGKNVGAEWGIALAQAGYVVVHMSHVPRTDAERTALAAEFNLTPTTVREVYEFESNVDRPRDTIAVLNALPIIEAAFTQSQGRFDYTRIGVAGHSYGSYSVRTATCARVALGSDPDYSFRAVNRHNTPLTIFPKALMAASPQGVGSYGFKADSWRECNLPDMSLTGVGDNTEGAPASQRTQSFHLMPPGSKHLMYINDAATIHNTFNLNDDVYRFDPELIATGTAFFDAYLRNSLIGKSYLASGRLEDTTRNVSTISTR